MRIIVASEALAGGTLTRRDLRRSYVRLHRNVYIRRDVQPTATDRVRAGWLWSGRRATMVGMSAALLLGSRWIPHDAPVELTHTRTVAAAGVIVRNDRIGPDEVCIRRGMRCTTAPRTAYDLARRLDLEEGVIRVDALLNATGTPVDEIGLIARRYPGARGLRQLRMTLGLVDGGAESPQESRLRLLLVRSGLPRPVTQIPVHDDRGRVARRIDLGWPQFMVGVEYDGEQHWSDPRQHATDIERLEFLAARGWRIVRVSAVQLGRQQDQVVARVRNALQPL